MAMKNSRVLWWILSGLHLPRNNARKSSKMWGKFGAFFGAKFWRKFESSGNFCSATSLTIQTTSFQTHLVKISLTPTDQEWDSAFRPLPRNDADRQDKGDTTWSVHKYPSGQLLPAGGRSEARAHPSLKWATKPHCAMGLDDWKAQDGKASQMCCCQA